MLSSETDTLTALFLDAVSRHPDRVALKTRDQEVTYLQLLGLAERLSQGLQSAGVRRGSLVGMHILRDEFRAVSSILALTLLGVPWIEYGPHLRHSRSIRMTHIIHDHPKQAPQRGVCAIDTVWPDEYGTPDPAAAQSFRGNSSADTPWFLASSSGTTGRPKTMVVGVGQYIARIAALTDYPEPTGGEDFKVVSLSGPYANLTWIHLWHAMSLGGSCLLSFEYPLLSAEQPDLIIGSPAQLTALLADQSSPEAPAFHECRVVGTKLNPRMEDRLRGYFRTLRISYGATEVGPVSSHLSERGDDGSSVGAPYQGVEVAIVNEGGDIQGAAEEGIVRIRTRGMVTGYIESEDSAGEAFRDGWFYPGDRGYLNSRGELCLSGRVQDHLNVGGTKVDAAVLDQMAQAAEGIADALCFVECDDAGVEHVAALIVIQAGKDKRAVVDGLLQHLSGTGVRAALLPANIYEVDAIPRTPSGKPVRHQAGALVAGLAPTARSGG